MHYIYATSNLQAAAHMRTRSKPVPNKSKGRSAVTNGTRLFRGLDHRSRPVRRYRDLNRIYLNQTKGAYPELCRQLAALVLKRELMDADLVAGKPVEVNDLVKISGAINRTLAKLKRVTVAPTDEAERRQREREDREALLMMPGGPTPKSSAAPRATTNRDHSAKCCRGRSPRGWATTIGSLGSVSSPPCVESR